MELSNLKRFVDEMKSGVRNFTDNGKCSSCGECCSNILPMSKAEIQAIKKYKRKHHIRDSSYRAGADFNFVYPFRDNENKVCTVYEIRPAICRDFKCDKPQNDIKVSRELFYQQKRTVYVRETFFPGSGKH